MVHHPMLKYQIEKFLGENPDLAPTLDGFLKEIDRTYQKFESDRAKLKKGSDSTDYFNEQTAGGADGRVETGTADFAGGDEQFFKRIVEATTEPIAVFGPSGDLFLTNDAFDSLFSLSEAKYEGNFLNLLTRDSSHSFRSNILSALEQGGTWEGVLEASLRSGDAFPLWFRGDAILDDTGGILFVIGIMHDASGQDLVERTLTAYQNSGQQVDMRQGSYAALQQLADAVGRQSALLQCILDIAWLKDAEGRYLAVNKVFCRWFGFEEIEVIGRTDAELLPEYTSRMMTKTDEEVIRQSRLLRKEVAVQGSDGRIYWCELIKVPSYTDSGAISGIAGIMRDISITKERSSRPADATVKPVADFMATREREAAAPVAPKPEPAIPAEPVSPTPVSPVEEGTDKGKYDLQQRDAIMAAINLAAEYFLRVPPWEKHIHDVLEWLGRATNVSRVSLMQNMREEGGLISARIRYEWTASGIAGNMQRQELKEFDYEAAGFRRWIDAMQSGDIILGNVKDFPEQEQVHFKTLGTTSIVGVPVFVDGAWWGYLGFEECVIDREWKPIIIDVLKTAAHLIGAVIERERTEGTYRSMVEHSLQELMIAQHGRIVYANPEAVRNSGLSEQELYRFGSTDIYANVLQEDSAIVSQALAQLKSGPQESVRVEFRAVKPDGTTRWLEALMSRVSYKGSPAIQIVQVDISDRKRAESALKERSSLELLVSNISSKFINIGFESIDNALHEALSMLGGFYSADRCLLVLNDEKGNNGAISHEWSAAGVADMTQAQLGYRFSRFTWLDAELEEKGAVLWSDIRTMPKDAQQEQAFFVDLDLRSVAVAAVRVQGRMVGNLTLGFTRQMNAWADDVVPGLSLAGDIMINAFQRKRAEESLVKTQERYDLATEAGGVGVWDWDLVTGEVYIDATLKEMLGYSDSEIPNSVDEWLKYFHPEDYPDAAKRLADVRSGNVESYTTEQRMVHRDGHTVWFLVTGKVLRDTRGNAVRIVGTDANITALKETEGALRDSQLQNSAIINSLPDLVFIANSEGMVTAILEGEARRLNAQFRDVPANRNLYDFLSRDAAERYLRAIRTVLESGNIEVIEYEHYDSVTEKLHHYESRLARLHSNAVLVITREITSRKASEKALIENNEILKVRNEELDAFSHTVAHDLKNPLTLVIGYAGLLNEAAADMKPDEVKQYLSNILLNSKRMNSIIESLLLLAEVRQEDVDLDELDMRFIVDEALSRLSYMIQEYMAVVVLPDEWPAAVGYSSWVEEVWVNYITNAMKYGGRPPKIELGADRNIPGYIRYWVKDNGKGIAQEDIDKLFSPLTRLGTGTIKGYGLGLSIVKRIVEKLHGKIGVDSEPGKGSMFWFALPEHVREVS